jgi:hypothetical protein
MRKLNSLQQKPHILTVVVEFFFGIEDFCFFISFLLPEAPFFCFSGGTKGN